MTLSDTILRLDAYWSGVLGDDVATLQAGEVRVVTHSESLTGYNGLYALGKNGGCIVSVPPDRLAWINESLAGRAAEDAFTESVLGALLPNVERVIGPASLAYADITDFAPGRSKNAQLLTIAYDSALRQLAAAVGETQWTYSGIEFDREPIFGDFEGEMLVAACSYEQWGEHIQHAGVVTHPAHRGRGHGRAVASLATEHGLRGGWIMQWQTLEANIASLRVGESLGYRPYCRTIAVRLRA